MGYRGSVGGYRGRKTGHDILKTVVVVLAVLAVVLIGITLLGSDSLMEKLAILSPQQSVSQQEEPQKENLERVLRQVDFAAKLGSPFFHHTVI